MPVYGDGQQIRDWLYVKDHCSAIRRVLEAGVPGETYNIGGWNEKPNIDIVHTICALLDALRPQSYRILPQSDQLSSQTVPAMTAVMQSMRAKSSANWAGNLPKLLKPAFAKPCNGIWTTRSWVGNVQSGAYRTWVEKNYQGRS